jgi:hypothetical protein
MDAETWHIPLGRSYYTIQQALNTMSSFKLNQDEVPFIIRLFENPKYNILPGAVTLDNHDIIHVLLSRGLLVKDEAFVIGFTMGTTDRLTKLNKAIFKFVTRFLYPPEYKFHTDEVSVFESGVACAQKMKCSDLSKLDLTQYLDYTIERAREELNIDINILRKAYAYEQATYSAPECQRLLQWI